MSEIAVSSVMSIVPDDTFIEESRVVAALKKAEHLERVGTTLKLYIIAKSVEFFGFEKTHEIVGAAFHHTDDYIGKLIAVAMFVGADMLRQALETGNELTFDQWRAISEAPKLKHDDLYRLATQEDANPIEIHASSKDTSIEEVKAKRVIEALWRLLREADKMKLREEVIRLLEEYGYIAKVITSSRASKNEHFKR